MNSYRSLRKPASVLVVVMFGMLQAVSALADTGTLDPDWLSSQIAQTPISSSATQMQKVGWNGTKDPKTGLWSGGALNQAVLDTYNANPNFTHAFNAGPITNQQSTGDCWLYAGTTVLVSHAITNFQRPATLSLSQDYIYFYSLVEKANLYLNIAISLRNKVDRMSLKQIQAKLNPTSPTSVVNDGGWWETFASLVQRYGIVPTEAMPDTATSLNDSRLLSDLEDFLAASVQRIYAQADTMTGQSDAAILKALNQYKETQVLSQALVIITAHLGKPPTQFTYSVDGQSYTPQTFLANYLKFDFTSMVHVSSYPTLAAGGHYTWNKSSENSLYNSSDETVSFITVAHDRLRDLLTASVLQNYAPWIGIDVIEDVDNDTGIMDTQIFNRAGLYPGLEPSVLALDPLSRMKMGILSPDHAVVPTGIDQADASQPFVKLKIQNSWGTSYGASGIFTMYRDWFDNYVFDIELPKSLLSPSETTLLNKAPVKLDQSVGG